MREVELAGIALEATTGTPVVVLREESAPNRLLHIFVGPLEAASIAMAASGQIPPRPQTHDLMVTLVEELGGRVDAVEVTELDEGSFLARLNIEGPGGRRFVDSRPSDAIALAVRLGAPVLVSDEVLDEAGISPSDIIDPSTTDPGEIDEAAIDDAVEEFRSFIDDVDPAAFADLFDKPPEESEVKDEAHAAEEPAAEDEPDRSDGTDAPADLGDTGHEAA